MRNPLSLAGGAILFFVIVSGSALAQSAVSAEARLKELNITLPADSAPTANFVNAVQTGKLLFLAGNTPGAQWSLKGKVGKDLTVEQGYQSARKPDLSCWEKYAPRSAASIVSSASLRFSVWSIRPRVSATSQRW